jgi:hypothetical protein
VAAAAVITGKRSRLWEEGVHISVDKERCGLFTGLMVTLRLRMVAAAATAEDFDSDILWSSNDPDGPIPEEKAAEQRAIVESFETLKDDAANARLQQILEEDATAHRAIAAAREAAEKQARERRNDGAGPSGSK